MIQGETKSVYKLILCLFFTSILLSSDYDKAIKLYEQGKIKEAILLMEGACKKNDSNACNEMGVLYLYGGDVKKDEKRSLSYFKKACELNNRDACFGYGYMLEQGLGTRVNKKLAEKIYMDSCKKGYDKSCLKVGALKIENGADGRDFFDEICQRNNYMGCYLLGALEIDRGNVKQGIKLLDFACKNNIGDSCYEMARYYFRLNKYTKTMAYYDKACSLQSWKGCALMGVEYNLGKIVKKDDKKAFELFSLSCNNGEMMGCQGLGYLYQKGEGVRKDIDQAIQLLGIACSGGLSLACNDLGVIYISDKKDSQKAKSFFNQACILGNELGCQNFQKILNH